ncbi:MAG: hypothetical protein IT371_16355 [Deltaproteobacteria bacterium]|nr:hypothetical protein [Deltaproteobacteria bacterium]
MRPRLLPALTAVALATSFSLATPNASAETFVAKVKAIGSEWATRRAFNKEFGRWVKDSRRAGRTIPWGGAGGMGDLADKMSTLHNRVVTGAAVVFAAIGTYGLMAGPAKESPLLSALFLGPATWMMARAAAKGDQERAKARLGVVGMAGMQNPANVPSKLRDLATQLALHNIARAKK